MRVHEMRVEKCGLLGQAVCNDETYLAAETQRVVDLLVGKVRHCYIVSLGAHYNTMVLTKGELVGEENALAELQELVSGVDAGGRIHLLQHSLVH